jgi:hypothetical protein
MLSIHFIIYRVAPKKCIHYLLINILECVYTFFGATVYMPVSTIIQVSEKDWTLFFIFFSRCPVCGEWCKLHWLNFWKKVQSFSDNLYLCSEIGCRNNFVTYLCTFCINCLCYKSIKKKLLLCRAQHTLLFDAVLSLLETLMKCYFLLQRLQSGTGPSDTQVQRLWFRVLRQKSGKLGTVITLCCFIL